jgi:hypothetical protein
MMLSEKREEKGKSIVKSLSITLQLHTIRSLNYEVSETRSESLNSFIYCVVESI